MTIYGFHMLSMYIVLIDNILWGNAFLDIDKKYDNNLQNSYSIRLQLAAMFFWE